MRKIRVKDFDKELQQILDGYGQTVTEKTKQVVLSAAKIAKQEVQAGAPVQTGAYQKGWTVTESSSRLFSEAIVHNRTRYQLAHLLEKGHAKQNGGRVAPIVHIKPAEENAIKNMEEAVKKIAEEG